MFVFFAGRAIAATKMCRADTRILIRFHDKPQLQLGILNQLDIFSVYIHSKSLSASHPLNLGNTWEQAMAAVVKLPVPSADVSHAASFPFGCTTHPVRSLEFFRAFLPTLQRTVYLRKPMVLRKAGAQTSARIESTLSCGNCGSMGTYAPQLSKCLRLQPSSPDHVRRATLQAIRWHSPWIAGWLRGGRTSG